VKCTKVDTVKHFADPARSLLAAARPPGAAAPDYEKTNCAAFNEALPMQQI